jgi:hypothetical protein
MNAQSSSVKCGDCGRSFANADEVRAHIQRRGCVDDRYVQLAPRERGRGMKRLIRRENDDDDDYDDKDEPDDDVEQEDNGVAVQHNNGDGGDAGADDESIDTAVGRVAAQHAKHQAKRRGPSVPRELRGKKQKKKKKKSHFAQLCRWWQHDVARYYHALCVRRQNDGDERREECCLPDL